MLEDNCHDSQDNFQQNVASPLAENQIDHHLDVDIHVPIYGIDVDVKQSYQILSNQERNEVSHSDVFLDQSFSKFQE